MAVGGLLSAVALVAAGLPAGAAAVEASPHLPLLDGATDNLDAVLDVRDVTRAVRPTTAQRDAAAALVAASGDGARLTWDRRFGTPRSLRRDGGYLTSPRTGEAADVARAWLTEHADAFRLTDADIAALTVARDHALPGTGTHVVTFVQTFDGKPAVRGGRMTVAVTKAGEIASYAGDPVGHGDLTGSYALSAGEALTKVSGALAPGVLSAVKQLGTRAGYTVFDRGAFAGPSYVKQVAFPTKDGARAAYRVQFVKALDEAWDVVVDASSGAVLYRASLAAHDASGTVYENYPGAPSGGQPVSRSFGPTAQSPKGWVDPTGVVGTGVTTIGNNASTYANYSNFLVPADQAPRPVAPTGQFDYVYKNRWAATKGSALPPSYVEDLNSAATNLFYQHNRIHDELYGFGFTESAGNFQVTDGAGTGGQGGDPILGLVHAGAASGGAPTYTGRDNAYMLTLDDGIPPWSGMFLWEPIDDAFEGPFSDGNFDASVVEHEYVHGLSNRYVAGGSALGSQQAGSMGEGWGDWYGLNHLFTAGLTTKAVVGQYVTGNAARGIRNYDYDQNPTGFGDIGYDVTGPEVHADGEIWTTMLWNLRKRLVAKYGAAKGAEVAARLVTDAMPLTAPDPSFLDARDGILAADVDRYHGDDTDLIWSVFASRGAGASAVTQTGDDTDPVPAFDHPAAVRNGTLSLKVVNATTGAAVSGAKVIIGRYEARVTPAARTSSTGGAALRMVAGSYPVLVQAPGFGVQSFTLAVSAGKTTAKTLRLAPNLLSTASGAKVVSTSSQDDGLPGTFAFDDTAASVWRTATSSTPYNAGPDQRVTVKLAKPATIDRIQVSAFPNVGGGRFATLKDFTVQVSDDGVLWRTVRTGAFGYQAPRPTAPDLNYRTFTLSSPVKAAYVRFFADSVQGDTSTAAQVAEIQAFGSSGALTPTAPAPDAPFTDSGTIVTGNPAAGDPTGLQNVFGVTGAEFTTTCALPVSSQGADGWVSKLPAGFGDGQHTVSVTGGESTPAGHDLDLYFLGSDCSLKGSAATAAADESTVVPGGTAYVLTQLYTGANVPFTLTARDAG
ncbi:coagulation factor 5/8 type-like protein [Angustibacter sp. Root456]|nr:coagulation factor 5/8 type-like protein [Angustibacter sp. Root456]